MNINIQNGEIIHTHACMREIQRSTGSYLILERDTTIIDKLNEDVLTQWSLSTADHYKINTIISTVQYIANK